MINSMKQLWLYEALDNKGSLTALGRKMAEFPLEPSLAKMLIVAEKLGCSEEVLIIVSMLSVDNVFYRPRDKEEAADQARENLKVPESDHLTYLNIYQQWKDKRYSDRWCTQHYIHGKHMIKAKKIYAQLADILRQQRVKIVSCG